MAAVGGESDVDWDGDESWAHFGHKEDPDRERRISELEAAEMDNLANSMKEFRVPQDHAQTSEMFKKIDEETSKRSRATLQEKIQENPDLAIHGQYQHLDIGHYVPCDPDDPDGPQEWIRIERARRCLTKKR